jgi:branched-chain amino acid transport system permease protein
VIERVLLSRLYGVEPATTLVFTFGLGLAIVEIVRWTQGLEFKMVHVPSGLEGSAQMLGCFFPWYRLFIIGLCGLLFLGVWLFLNKTTTGLVIRAGISDREMVRALGINIRRTFTLVFGLGVGLGGVGGIVAAPVTGVFPDMGAELMVLSFVVIIIGGMGSFGGTLIAAVLCGLLSSIFTIISAPMANIVIFIFMAVVLLVKPGGFFGEVTRYEH